MQSFKIETIFLEIINLLCYCCCRLVKTTRRWYLYSIFHFLNCSYWQCVGAKGTRLRRRSEKSESDGSSNVGYEDECDQVRDCGAGSFGFRILEHTDRIQAFSWESSAARAPTIWPLYTFSGICFLRIWFIEYLVWFQSVCVCVTNVK